MSTPNSPPLFLRLLSTSPLNPVPTRGLWPYPTTTTTNGGFSLVFCVLLLFFSAGDIPPGLGGLSNLKILYLNNNDLTGNFLCCCWMCVVLLPFCVCFCLFPWIEAKLVSVRRAAKMSCGNCWWLCFPFRGIVSRPSKRTPEYLLFWCLESHRL